MEHPWTLAKALSARNLVQPGDTIWLRGGVYNDAYVSRLVGARDMPIVVRGYPGERPVLDGNGIGWNKTALRVEGSWTWFQDFEITNSNKYTFGHARSSAAEVFGPHTKLINLLIYHTGQGPGFWTPAVDAEIYGCIIFHTGWKNFQRGHGHGIYTQNNTGTKSIRETVLFDQFGYNLHAFGSDNARLNGYTISGNVIFNGRVLVGGDTPARDIHLTDNYFFRTPIELGYVNAENNNLVFSGNTLAGGLAVRWWSAAQLTDNTLISYGVPSTEPTVSVYLRKEGGAADFQIDRNTYYGRDGQDFYVVQEKQGLRVPFAGWKGLGYDSQGAYKTYPVPSENRVVLRRNEYDRDRSHLIVYNWLRQDEVEVDLSSAGFAPGDGYQIRNIGNYFKEAIGGSYDGTPVRLPMNIWSAAEPIVMEHPEQPQPMTIEFQSTFPEFGVFLVTRRASPPPPEQHEPQRITAPPEREPRPGRGR